MSPSDLPVVWLVRSPATPPFSSEARKLAGFLLRQIQRGMRLQLPHSRAMSSVGISCHELRIPDGPTDWRIVYLIDDDAIVVLHVFKKKTRKTPKQVLDLCKKRISAYRERS